MVTTADGTWQTRGWHIISSSRTHINTSVLFVCFCVQGYSVYIHVCYLTLVSAR